MTNEERKFIYVVRHGETVWNRSKLLQGRTNIPLSDEGIRQAYELAALFQKIPLNFIGVSPLLRTKQTGSIVGRALNIPMEVFDELKAREYGPWEGKRIEVIKKENQELFEQLVHLSLDEVYATSPISSVESYETVSNRALRLLRRIQGENALLITHTGVVSAILMGLGYHRQTDCQEIPRLEHLGYMKIGNVNGELVIEEVCGLEKPINKKGAKGKQRVFVF